MAESNAVLVTGATGNVGRAVVDELLRRLGEGVEHPVAAGRQLAVQPAGVGLDVGVVLSVVALIVLGFIYHSTPVNDRLRLFAIALVSAGAVGNIIDRLRFEAGVVDFLDVGIGRHRWPIFNVADMAVSIGAVLLLISFYFEDKGGDEPEAESS